MSVKVILEFQAGPGRADDVKKFLDGLVEMLAGPPSIRFFDHVGV